MAGREPGESQKKRRINSIMVGFKLLHVLERSTTKLPLKTIAALAGMPASKAYLYMVSFSELGIVSQNPTTAHYGLGPYAIHLGLAAIRQLRVVDLVDAPMEALRDEFGLAVYLSVWGNMGPAIVRKLDGEFEGLIRTTVGHVMPLLSTATGRVFLAHLPAEQTKALMDREKLQDPALLARAEAAVELERQTGFGCSDEYMGLGAISAPIFDKSGGIVAALTMYGMRAHMKFSPDDRMAIALLDATAAISAELGHQSVESEAETPSQVEPKRKRVPVRRGAAVTRSSSAGPRQR